MSAASRPEMFIDLTGGGIDMMTQASPVVPTSQPTPPQPFTPPAPPVFVAPPVVVAPPAAAPPPTTTLRVCKDSLTVEDDGGGPTASHLTPAVGVRLMTVAPEIDQPKLNPIATASPILQPGVPVQAAVDDMLNAMMGKTPVVVAPVQAVVAAPVVPATQLFTPPPTYPAATQVVQPAPIVAQPMPPVVDFAMPVQVPPVTAAPSVQPVVADPVADSAALWADIENTIRSLRRQTGQCVLDDPYDPANDFKNIVHVAIWNMRYNPATIDMTAHDLCVYEAALAAHQVWVQSVENWWRARCDFLGPELSKVLRIKRGQYKADTEKAREDAVCAAEPGVEQMRREFVKARAVATYLQEFSVRFSKLEDGLKRPIDNRQEEENRTSVQGGWNP